MGRVGQERERGGPDSNAPLKGHEPDNQQQRGCQIPTVRVRGHALRVTADAVLVTSVIVTMLAHLSMRIVITTESSMVVHITPRHSTGLVGALPVHPRKHYANYRPQKDRGAAHLGAFSDQWFNKNGHLNQRNRCGRSLGHVRGTIYGLKDKRSRTT